MTFRPKYVRSLKLVLHCSNCHLRRATIQCQSVCNTPLETINVRHHNCLQYTASATKSGISLLDRTALLPNVHALLKPRTAWKTASSVSLIWTRRRTTLNQDSRLLTVSRLRRACRPVPYANKQLLSLRRGVRRRWN